MSGHHFQAFVARREAGVKQREVFGSGGGGRPEIELPDDAGVIFQSCHQGFWTGSEFWLMAVSIEGEGVMRWRFALAHPRRKKSSWPAYRVSTFRVTRTGLRRLVDRHGVSMSKAKPTLNDYNGTVQGFYDKITYTTKVFGLILMHAPKPCRTGPHGYFGQFGPIASAWIAPEIQLCSHR